MKNGVNRPISQIQCDNAYEGESIEAKMRRVTANNEPIKDGAPTIYTERKAGVIPAYNIRTDRWEVAQEAMDNANRSWVAERDNKINPPKKEEGGDKE